MPSHVPAAGAFCVALPKLSAVTQSDFKGLRMRRADRGHERRLPVLALCALDICAMPTQTLYHASHQIVLVLIIR